MISIAMVVILMVGIHQVFKMSSDTMGMGHQLGDWSRSNRSVQQIFNDDYSRLLKNAPLFIIRSGVAGAPPNSWGAFTTDAERSADRDGNPLTQDFNNDGQEGTSPGETTPLCVYNSRNHRIDVIGFPASGLFRRNTANDGSYSSPTTSQDAFIVYQHVRLPTNGNGFDPGDPVAANVNNSLAGQWVLGRVALLMRDGFTIPKNENYIARNNNTPPDLSPLRFNSTATTFLGAPQRFFLDCRYDLLGLSLESFRQDLADVRTVVGQNDFDGMRSTWWQPLVYRVNIPPPPPWNNALANAAVARFDCNPHISKPITSESMAKAMPVLLNNCSQFLVEFAGDFVTQDNEQMVFNKITKLWEPNPDWGRVTDCVPDGVVDYVVDHSRVTNSDYNVSSRVRWYGLPRDIDGDGIIKGFSSTPSYPRVNFDKSGNYGGSSNNNELVDVVPVDDVRRTAGNKYFASAFERELPMPDPGGDYMQSTKVPGNFPFFRYTNVWVNSAPKMIRIVLKLEDPAGRLPEGQWYEYVVGAP